MAAFTHLLLGLAAWAAGPSETTTHPPFELDPIVVSSEGVPTPLDAATAATVVITEAEIRARGASHVSELLREVAGVVLLRSGSPGKAATVRMRGGNANQTLVLVDGLALNSPTLGQADLADMTVDNIERIEVVRGPQSSLYGSDAIGGLIHIITKRGSGPPAAWASAEGGNLGALWLRAGTAGSAGETADWSLNVSRFGFDGQEFLTPSGDLASDGYDNLAVSGRLGLRLGASRSHRLDLSLRVTDADRDLPIEVFGGPAFDVNGTQADRQIVVSGAWSAQFGRWQPTLRLGITDAVQDFDDPLDPGETGPFATDLLSRTETSRQTLRWENAISWSPHHELLAGLTWDRRQGLNEDNLSGTNFDEDFESRSVFMSHRWVAPDSLVGPRASLVATGGFRVDGTDTFGTTVSPRLGMLATLADGQARLRVNYAHGFREPSINELSFPFYGNRALESERSRSFEVGLGSRVAEGRADIELRWFRTRFEDLIASDPVTFQATNLASSTVDGVELEGRFLVRPDLYLTGSYTYQDSQDEATGDELLRQPRHRGALALTYRTDAYRIAVSGILQGSMRDIVLADTPDRLAGWERLDVSGGVRLGASRRVELYGSVENLFDAAYEELKGFPAPGVQARIGLRADW